MQLFLVELQGGPERVAGHVEDDGLGVLAHAAHDGVHVAAGALGVRPHGQGLEVAGSKHHAGRLQQVRVRLAVRQEAEADVRLHGRRVQDRQLLHVLRVAAFTVPVEKEGRKRNVKELFYLLCV